MSKAMVWYKATNPGKFCAGLSEVIKVDPDNVTARNNLGVMLVRSRQWGPALTNLAKAAAADSDVVLDNFDQVRWMAEQDGAAAMVLNDSDRMFRQVMTQLRLAKEHTGKSRWGNTWIADEEYRKFVNENGELDRQIAAIRTRVDSLRQPYAKLLARKKQMDDDRAALVARMRQSYTGTAFSYARDEASVAWIDSELPKIRSSISDMAAEVKRLQEDIGGVDARRHVPPHSGKLVMLKPDGKTELETITFTPPAPPPVFGKLSGQMKSRRGGSSASASRFIPSAGCHTLTRSERCEDRARCAGLDLGTPCRPRKNRGRTRCATHF